MTGFLNLDLLHAHAAPRDRWPDRGRAAFARPHLIARWERASDGRLVCRWRIDDRTEAEPLASVRPLARAVCPDLSCQYSEAYNDQ
jgi:hypothetical protein